MAGRVSSLYGLPFLCEHGRTMSSKFNPYSCYVPTDWDALDARTCSVVLEELFLLSHAQSSRIFSVHLVGLAETIEKNGLYEAASQNLALQVLRHFHNLGRIHLYDDLELRATGKSKRYVSGVVSVELLDPPYEKPSVQYTSTRLKVLPDRELTPTERNVLRRVLAVLRKDRTLAAKLVERLEEIEKFSRNQREPSQETLFDLD